MGFVPTGGRWLECREALALRVGLACLTMVGKSFGAREFLDFVDEGGAD
jgi:hypothetical protein